VADFRCTDDLVADEDVGNAGLDKHGSLADLLAADSHSAQCDLSQGDLRTLVALGVGTQTHVPAAQCVSHSLQITLECIQVEHERGCIDGNGRVADLGCFPGTHGDFL
jgi:hypothetical protein